MSKLARLNIVDEHAMREYLCSQCKANDEKRYAKMEKKTTDKTFLKKEFKTILVFVSVRRYNQYAY